MATHLSFLSLIEYAAAGRLVRPGGFLPSEAARLARELALWRHAGRRALLWWRDDDAQRACRPLGRLLRLSDHHRIPLTLAVIPSGDCRGVAAQVAGRPLVRLAQHGVDHRNRREPGAAGEFPLEMSRAQLARRLACGWSRLASLPGAVPIFVPPWNDVHPRLAGALADAGYVGWSAASGRKAPHGPPRLDGDIDILSWEGGARFKGVDLVASELCRALSSRRRSGRWLRPIGLVTHHLEHDLRTWAFLELFFAWSRRHPALCWRSLETLLPPTGVETVLNIESSIALPNFAAAH